MQVLDDLSVDDGDTLAAGACLLVGVDLPSGEVEVRFGRGEDLVREVELGGVDRILPLRKIPGALVELIRRT